MDASISPGNGFRQPAIFLPGTAGSDGRPLKCDMAKAKKEAPLEIFLGQWLDFFEVDVGEAAKIAGCTQGYISNIIANRKTNINVLYLFKISTSLGVTINDFYRPLPRKAELDAFKELSPKAQAAILQKERKKA
jgi:hypothetical protein